MRSSRLLVNCGLMRIFSEKSPMRARSSGSKRRTKRSAASFRKSMLSVMLPLVSSMATTVMGWTSLLKSVMGCLTRLS